MHRLSKTGIFKQLIFAHPAERSLSRELRTCAVLTSVLIAVSIGSYFAYYKDFGFLAALVIAASAWVVQMVYASPILHWLILGNTRDVESAKKAVAIARDRVDSIAESEIVNRTIAVLDFFAKKEKLELAYSRRLEKFLRNVASLLIFASTLAPFATAIIYFFSSPIDTSSIAALMALPQGINEMIDIEGINLDRDWRVLASGVSFALVFLGAAAALMTQIKQLTQWTSLLMRRTTVFHMLQSGIELSRGNADQDSTVAAAEQVVALMLDPKFVFDLACGDSLTNNTESRESTTDRLASVPFVSDAAKAIVDSKGASTT